MMDDGIRRKVKIQNTNYKLIKNIHDIFEDEDDDIYNENNIMHNKDYFIEWHNKKIFLNIPNTEDTDSIDLKKKIKMGQVKESEFWWYYNGMNVGEEVSKQSPFERPCLILNVKLGADLVYIVPITSSEDVKYKSFVEPIDNPAKYGLKGGKESSFILNQIKAISIRRLIRRISGKEKSTGEKYVDYEKVKLKNLRYKLYKQVLGSNFDIKL
ncbi:MAG: type II toxin-antitoxin system PemK/MazF family toxin [Candidatus Gracilibacteria bacterium]|nr:type II toxin-antitoxin system PemK/MazF family toxin [Candidatus Gracilibacteria bacterium]